MHHSCYGCNMNDVFSMQKTSCRERETDTSTIGGV